MSDTVTAVILGVVEGLTEFLPVSSTGHLILATELLGYDAQKWALFNIAIQPGAIMAIIVLYWRTFAEVLRGLPRLESGAIAFVRNVLIGFLPAAVVGFALNDLLDALLGNATIVAWALIAGGVAILIVERFSQTRARGGVGALSWPLALKIGLTQCLALVPGVSRSGATILGAMALGVDRKTAAEFSFFLAVPTLVGATALKLFKASDAITSRDLGLIAIGFAVSFVVALVVVKLFVSMITRYGFAPFAWYRIAAGLAALVWLG